jgi:hypothetical protein
MKLKAIFLLFNGVLVVSFLLIFLMPLFLLGTDSFSIFWQRNWIIAAVFVVTLGAVNGYFLFNWKLFTSLEREDWPSLVTLLEERVLRRGRAWTMYVRMLLNAYLITSNTEGILVLEAFLRPKRPRLIGRFSTQFCIPYLLMKDPAASEGFFSGLLQSSGVARRDWVRWNRCFSLIQQRKLEEARGELSSLSVASADPAVRLLSLYLLDVVARDDPEAEKLVEEGKRLLKASHPAERMSRALERSGENMEVVVLARIVRDARDWLYGDGMRPGGGTGGPGEGSREGTADAAGGGPVVH